LEGGGRVKEKHYWFLGKYCIPGISSLLQNPVGFAQALAVSQRLFKIWNFGVANAKILPCRLKKSPKIGIFTVY
jgi:hypothetical protein